MAKYKFELFIEGRPLPQPRKWCGARHPIWGWRNLVALKVKALDGPGWPLQTPVVALSMDFVLEKGQRVPDGKNLFTACEDAMSRIVYKDDKLVIAGRWTRKPYSEGLTPGVHLTIEYCYSDKD